MRYEESCKEAPQVVPAWANTLANCPITVVWVTWPERPKGAKDKVKQAQSRPKGTPARSQGPENCPNPFARGFSALLLYS